ncbi:hypothetical protein BDW62DRAFT_184069 [Aspergillus aurantiobrunneus]
MTRRARNTGFLAIAVEILVFQNPTELQKGSCWTVYFCLKQCRMFFSASRVAWASLLTPSVLRRSPKGVIHQFRSRPRPCF